jgi:hypothetical protein
MIYKLVSFKNGLRREDFFENPLDVAPKAMQLKNEGYYGFQIHCPD